MDRLKIRDQKARKTPYKPQMTPKRGRGGGRRQTNNYSRGRGDRDNYRSQQNSRFRGKPRNQQPFGRGRGRFDKSPNVSWPRVAGRTPNKDDKTVFLLPRKLGTLWTDVTRKRATDKRPQKRPSYDYYRTLQMGKMPCPYLTQLLTLGMTTQRMNILTS